MKLVGIFGLLIFKYLPLSNRQRKRPENET